MRLHLPFANRLKYLTRGLKLPLAIIYMHPMSVVWDIEKELGLAGRSLALQLL